MIHRLAPQRGCSHQLSGRRSGSSNPILRLAILVLSITGATLSCTSDAGPVHLTREGLDELSCDDFSLIEDGTERAIELQIGRKRYVVDNAANIGHAGEHVYFWLDDDTQDTQLLVVVGPSSETPLMYDFYPQDSIFAEDELILLSVSPHRQMYNQLTVTVEDLSTGETVRSRTFEAPAVEGEGRFHYLETDFEVRDTSLRVVYRQARYPVLAVSFSFAERGLGYGRIPYERQDGELTASDTSLRVSGSADEIRYDVTRRELVIPASAFSGTPFSSAVSDDGEVAAVAVHDSGSDEYAIELLELADPAERRALAIASFFPYDDPVTGIRMSSVVGSTVKMIIETTEFDYDVTLDMDSGEADVWFRESSYYPYRH
jgi:hypothetical protein